MNYSASNPAMWNFIVQLGIIAAAVIGCNILRRKVPFLRKTLLPVPVLAGFVLLILKVIGVYKADAQLLEMMVFHCIALGFIAMSLRTRENSGENSDKITGIKSGAIIVATYLVQAVVGLIITITLAYTVMPNLFKAAGLLLPMGYGQGPGQANNVGTSYEALGFAGGRSFGLAIAAAGYICACTMGVLMLNRWAKKGLLRKGSSDSETENITTDYFQDKNEIPISDSLDKFSVQVLLILLVYLATYLFTWGLTSGISAISEGLANTVNSLLWGFNFIIGSALAMVTRTLLSKAHKLHMMTRQYQNNYLLNRISGFFFDIMIVAGIASINPEEISGLLLPFVLMAVAGGICTWLFLTKICKKVYGDFYREGLISMYGMLTGTIGSGILLLREIDPELTTPAANYLIVGSSYGIIFGAPLLILISLAAKSTALCFITLGLATLYCLLLLLVIYKLGSKKNK